MSVYSFTYLPFIEIVVVGIFIFWSRSLRKKHTDDLPGPKNRAMSQSPNPSLRRDKDNAEPTTFIEQYIPLKPERKPWPSPGPRESQLDSEKTPPDLPTAMPEDRWVKLPFQRGGVPYHGSATVLAATRRLREVIAHDLPWEDRIAVSMYEQAGEYIKRWEALKDIQIRLRSKGKNLSRVDQRNMGFYHWSAERILLMAIDWVLEKEEHDNRLEDAINREQARIRRQRGAHQLGPILVNRGAQPE